MAKRKFAILDGDFDVDPVKDRAEEKSEPVVPAGQTVNTDDYPKASGKSFDENMFSAIEKTASELSKGYTGPQEKLSAKVVTWLTPSDAKRFDDLCWERRLKKASLVRDLILAYMDSADKG